MTDHEGLNNLVRHICGLYHQRRHLPASVCEALEEARCELIKYAESEGYHDLRDRLLEPWKVVYHTNRHRAYAVRSQPPSEPAQPITPATSERTYRSRRVVE